MDHQNDDRPTNRPTDDCGILSQDSQRWLCVAPSPNASSGIATGVAARRIRRRVACFPMTENVVAYSIATTIGPPTTTRTGGTVGIGRRSFFWDGITVAFGPWKVTSTSMVVCCAPDRLLCTITGRIRKYHRHRRICKNPFCLHYLVK
jgi:hypothetical protein